MPRPAVLLAAALAALCLALPDSARAGWFRAAPVEPPSPDVLAVGDVDIARDGTGAMVYLKRAGGVPHVFLSRLVDGAWLAPERVDAGIDAAAAEPVVAVADEHRLLVAWTSGGRLHGSFLPGGSASAPLAPPRALFDGEATGLDADLGINGNGYVVFAAGGADVRAVRLFRESWEGVDAPLDIDPARVAGDGAGRPRVAAAADGSAVVAWGETEPDGRRRVFARRVFGTSLSVVPQELSLDEFAGLPGGDAELPELDVEEDSSWAWAVFRQQFGTTTRAIARRLVGSLWEAPVAVDGGGPVGAPAIAMSGRGTGVAAVAGAADGAVHASLLEHDAFGPPQRLDAGPGASPQLGVAVAASDRDEQAVAWRTPAGELAARYRPRQAPFDAEMVLSHPLYGGVAPDGGLRAGQSRLGDVALAFVQAGPDGRAPMVAVYDRPPGRPYGITSDTRWQTARPTLRWQPASELWGQTFEVFVDGKLVATTTQDTVTLPAPLSSGRHRWSVTTVDRRGQSATMRAPRRIRIDAVLPRVRMASSGRTVRVRARDAGGSGFKRLRVQWGDGARTSTRTATAVRSYRRGGRVTVTVRAVDRAGNVARKRAVIRLG